MARQKPIDIWNRFRPTPSQEKFLRSKAFGRLFSSGYGSGKSSVGCRESIRWAIQYAGSRNLVGRLTATELRDTTMVTFFKQLDEIGLRKDLHYTFNRSDKIMEWRNGSVTIFRHLDDPEGLGSLELSSAFVDEGSEVPDNIYMTLSSSRLRWHLPERCDQQDRVASAVARGASPAEIAEIRCDCPRGIWVCTNPGGSGYLRAVTRGEVPDWEWIKASPADNPYNGPDYYAKMERDKRINGPVWFKKFYEGDWDAFEGQRFPMFDRERHILPEPFVPDPDRHRIIEGWDFGHVETFVAWLAYDPKGDEPVVCFAELQMQEVQELSDVVERVKEIRKQFGPVRPAALGDPAGVGATQVSAVSPIAACGAMGIHISPCKAGKSPIDRANLLAEFLTGKVQVWGGKVWPGIVFGPDCPAAVSSILDLRWKPPQSRVGEDPRERFVDKNKHGFDAVTFALTGIPPPRTRERRPWSPEPGINLDAADARRLLAG